jgi:hypothetical protein
VLKWAVQLKGPSGCFKKTDLCTLELHVHVSIININCNSWQ